MANLNSDLRSLLNALAQLRPHTASGGMADIMGFIDKPFRTR